MRTTDLPLIRRSRLFAQVAEPDLAAMLTACFVQTLPAGAVLCRQGEKAEFLHIVLSGRVGLFGEAARDEALVEFFGPGDAFIVPAVVLDAPYLLNAALWDGFFLSGAAPRLSPLTSPASPVPSDPEANRPGLSYPSTRSLAEVLDDFMAQRGKLENPRMRLTGEAPASRSALGDYRRSASALLNDGAFNVNSTSVEAWAAFLASAKRIAVAKWPATGPSADANARFPRATPTGIAPSGDAP